MNPCCCTTLRKGALIIGIFDIILQSLRVIIAVASIGGLIYIKGDPEGREKFEKAGHNPDDIPNYIVVLSLALVLRIVQLLIGIMLVVGVKRSSQMLVKTWLIIKGVSFVLSVILLVVSLGKGEASINDTLSTIISSLFSLYVLWVVYAYFQELRKGGTGEFSTV